MVNEDLERIKAKTKLAQAVTKKTTAEEKKLRTEQKIKEAKAKKWKQLEKKLTKKVTSRKILRPSNLVLTIKEHTPESVFHDKSRFFNDEFEQTKKLFFKS